MTDSIITPEALERCADALERREHIEALRALEHARAKKRIDDWYDAILRGETPEHPNRRMLDRRFMNSSWTGLAAKFTQEPRLVSDMRDIDMHLDADSFVKP